MAGHRQKEYPSSPNPEEHGDGINPNGHDLDPRQRRPRSSHKQHIQRQETSKRHHFWGSRGIYGGIKIRGTPYNFPLLFFLPLSFHKVFEPGLSPYFRPTGPFGNSQRRIFDRAFREGLYFEHCGKQALLFSHPTFALDFWTGSGFSLLCRNGAGSLQPRLYVSENWEGKGG